MTNTETPEERKQRQIDQLKSGQARMKAEKEAGTYVPPIHVPRRPKNLDRIVREILDDDTIVDQVIKNQPEYWSKLPRKNGAYIIATVMMVKAMGGDQKSADWIRKTGWGDRVTLESDNGFFSKDSFVIQVVPAKQLEDKTINSQEVLEDEIRQVEE